MPPQILNRETKMCIRDRAYRLPPRSGKASVYELDREQLISALEGVESADDIMHRLDGLSPLAARELIHRGLDAAGMADIILSLASGEGQPWLVRRGGRDFDISAMEITQYLSLIHI